MDILIAMAREADVSSLNGIIIALGPWLTNTNANMQKKAYRLLAEIYQRINDSTLRDFFNGNMTQVRDLINAGIDGAGAKVTAAAWPWRLAVYRSVSVFF